jgi:hypothetical protein
MKRSVDHDSGLQKRMWPQGALQQLSAFWITTAGVAPGIARPSSTDDA